ncbi:MAG TPA: hypothetical protein VF316_23760 [Polyangiaceae bacterium]
MSGPDPTNVRFDHHRAELRAAAGTSIVDPDRAGAVLAMAGDLLRRSACRAGGGNEASKEIEPALAAVGREAAVAYVASLDATRLRTTLLGAFEDAFEAMLADTTEERSLFAEGALLALGARDHLASVRAALLWSELDTATLDAKLSVIDQGLRERARMLAVLNPRRRDELSLLDEDARGEAFWFGDRNGCDALLAIYTNRPLNKGDETHLAGCEACKRDAKAVGYAVRPAHVSAAILRRIEDGAATAAEVRFVEHHAKGCKACAVAVEAVRAVDVD